MLGFGKRSITDTEETASSFMEHLRELSLQLSRKNIGAQRSLRTRALRRSGPGCLEGAVSTTGTWRWALKRDRGGVGVGAAGPPPRAAISSQTKG